MYEELDSRSPQALRKQEKSEEVGSALFDLKGVQCRNVLHHLTVLYMCTLLVHCFKSFESWLLSARYVVQIGCLTSWGFRSALHNEDDGRGTGGTTVQNWGINIYGAFE